ncbi:MAG TPA: hypothetical protein VMU39_11865 [Solirubrobacteraceae bacterium]|nr:hypothetical protein [Solirubrobacteraceae bacterium]
MRSLTLSNGPLRIAWRVMIEKNTSTRFSHEPYVERWLSAPLQLEDGTLKRRDRGSPQGSAISPVHEDINHWLSKNPRITLRFTPTSWDGGIKLHLLQP